MAAETQAQAETGQSANGTGPAPAPGQPCTDCGATASERVMGAIGILAAAGLLFIGIDLATGGALSRALFGDKADDAAG